jgi:hypothetical protein
MRKKDLSPDDIAFNDWMERNKWFIWSVIGAAVVALISLVGLFILNFGG